MCNARQFTRIQSWLCLKNLSSQNLLLCGDAETRRIRAFGSGGVTDSHALKTQNPGLPHFQYSDENWLLPIPTRDVNPDCCPRFGRKHWPLLEASGPQHCRDFLRRVSVEGGGGRRVGEASIIAISFLNLYLKIVLFKGPFINDVRREG